MMQREEGVNGFTVYSEYFLTRDVYSTTSRQLQSHDSTGGVKMRHISILMNSLVFSCLLTGAASVSQAAIVTATYQVTAGDFEDSNFNPPPSPSTTAVSGTVTFTFDTEIPSQNEIMPDTVTGFDITDNDGITLDYDETNSGVNTDLNIFTDFGRITYGGSTSSVDFMVGISDDFRLQWDINLTDFEVTSVFENFVYVTTADPFYRAGYTTVELISVSAVPIGPAAPMFLLGATMIGLVSFRRKERAEY
jgi:hypothetical protein